MMKTTKQILLRYWTPNIRKSMLPKLHKNNILHKNKETNSQNYWTNFRNCSAENGIIPTSQNTSWPSQECKTCPQVTFSSGTCTIGSVLKRTKSSCGTQSSIKMWSYWMGSTHFHHSKERWKSLLDIQLSWTQQTDKMKNIWTHYGHTMQMQRIQILHKDNSVKRSSTKI